MKYEHIVTEVFRKPWAILPESFSIISQMIALRVSGERLTEHQVREALAPSRAAAAARGNGGNYGAVAVIPIRGVISHRTGLMSQISGGTSVEKLRSSFRQAVADSSIKAIVFDVDSPGGSVEGVPELADEILKSRSHKKTVAIANGMAASAAYWLASAAGEMVVTPSGQVGSIGIFVAHEDLSKMMDQAGVKVSLISAGKYKTEGNDYEPLSDEARAELQSKVDAFYEMFVKSVARGRGSSISGVLKGFGQGRMVLAADAVKQDMVDRVATMDETLARLGAASGNPARMVAAADVPEIRADMQDEDCACACAACDADDCAACTVEGCSDEPCAANGCPMQTEASAKAKAADPLAMRRRELDLHRH